jgi:hypothetical protein
MKRVSVALALLLPVAAQAATVPLDNALAHDGGVATYSAKRHLLTVFFHRNGLIAHWRQYRSQGFLSRSLTLGEVRRHPYDIRKDMEVALDAGAITWMYITYPKANFFVVRNIKLSKVNGHIEQFAGVHYAMDHKLYEVLINHSSNLLPFTRYVLNGGAPY